MTKPHQMVLVHPGWRTLTLQSALCLDKVTALIRTNISAPNYIKTTLICRQTISLQSSDHWTTPKTRGYPVCRLIPRRLPHGKRCPPPTFPTPLPLLFIPMDPTISLYSAPPQAHIQFRLTQGTGLISALSSTAAALTPLHPPDHTLFRLRLITKTTTHISPYRNPNSIRALLLKLYAHGWHGHHQHRWVLVSVETNRFYGLWTCPLKWDLLRVTRIFRIVEKTGSLEH